jgi:serine/threonine protein kinase
MVGKTISHYRIVAQLGAGGMGVVYRAEDVRLGREVALKFISDDLSHDEQAVRRLRSEARAASALNHGNICTIYDIGEDEGHPFIVMELMKGRTLRDCLATGPLRIHQTVDLGIEAADALQAAHSQGIVHRDIKPGNLFLTDRGHVKILDFGLAKLTNRFMASGSTGATNDKTVAGVTLGTVNYMSPEQATGEELDGRTDLFSLGVVLYECATGRHPFQGKTSAVILSAILNRAPVAPITFNPELPVRLQDVINNCLEKDRELRYQSAADLRADLKRVRRDIESGHSRTVETAVSSGSSRGAAPSPGSRFFPSDVEKVEAPEVERRHPRSRIVLVATVVAVVAVIGAGSYAVLRRPAARPAPDTTRIAALSDAAVRGRLALANSSLEARNYRAALTYATEVLAVDAHHAGAAKIRDEARTMLERFDAALAESRRNLSSGDIQAAARSLETARSIDPTAPSVSELAAHLAEQVRQREALNESTRKSRPVAEPTTRPSRTPAAPPAPVRSTPAPAAPQPAVPPPPSPVQTDPRVETPAVEPKPAPAPTSAVVESEPATPPKPAPPPAVVAERPETESTSPRAPSAEEDEAAIRRVTVLYGRAIENKDLALFRSIKPNLSSEEERRLQAGFQAVTSQRVNLTILSIEQRGDKASVVLRRRDTIEVGRRQQTTESNQTLTMARARDGWVIVDIR